jgi:CHAD domain-containing protein
MQKNGARATEPTELSPPSDLGAYAAHMIAERLHKMLALVDDVRRSEETEPVHKMRVASRRTRAALDIFDTCFAHGDYKRLEREVKTITRVLSEARDLDVMQEKLADHLRELPQEQRTGLQELIDQLHERREHAQKAVNKTLRRLESHDLEAAFKTIAARNRPDSTPSRRAIAAAGQEENGHG